MFVDDLPQAAGVKIAIALFYKVFLEDHSLVKILS